MDGTGSSRRTGTLIPQTIAAARFLKSTRSGRLLGNENEQIDTRIRNDNSSVVEHVHSINADAKDRWLNGFIESNREGPGTNPCLALSHITGPLNISDEMAKTKTRGKLILHIRRNDQNNDPRQVGLTIISNRGARKERLR